VRTNAWDETKRQYLCAGRDALRLYKAIRPDARANEFLYVPSRVESPRQHHRFVRWRRKKPDRREKPVLFSLGKAEPSSPGGIVRRQLGSSAACSLKLRSSRMARSRPESAGISCVSLASRLIAYPPTMNEYRLVTRQRLLEGRSTCPGTIRRRRALSSIWPRASAKTCRPT